MRRAKISPAAIAAPPTIRMAMIAPPVVAETVARLMAWDSAALCVVARLLAIVAAIVWRTFWSSEAALLD
jgi:hypothetical protein